MVKSTSANGKKFTARVAVVAAGVVSPLGFGLSETLDSLREARDCVNRVTRFSVAQCRCKTAGQVPAERLLDKQCNRVRARRLHRASHMIIYALGEALTQEPQFKPELTVIGTTSGGMSYGEDYYRSLKQGGNLRHSPTWIANYPAQKPVIDALEAFGIAAPCEVVSNACASGTNAIGHAFDCVRSGRYQRVLTGGYDALSELVFVGFDSLQASTPEKCRPFDRHRTGMVLGEGAAVLALENFNAARARGTTVLAEIQSAHTSADAVDYINAHGTATPFNDTAEGKAISELFDRVPVSSTKSMMGHSLGAAGAVEAVICLLALQHQFLPPNINFRAPDEDIHLNIVANKAQPALVSTVLSNSFGFGGTNASILMRKFDA